MLQRQHWILLRNPRTIRRISEVYTRLAPLMRISPKSLQCFLRFFCERLTFFFRSFMCIVSFDSHKILRYAVFFFKFSFQVKKQTPRRQMTFSQSQSCSSRAGIQTHAPGSKICNLNGSNMCSLTAEKMGPRGNRAWRSSKEKPGIKQPQKKDLQWKQISDRFRLKGSGLGIIQSLEARMRIPGHG